MSKTKPEYHGPKIAGLVKPQEPTLADRLAVIEGRTPPSELKKQERAEMHRRVYGQGSCTIRPNPTR